MAEARLACAIDCLSKRGKRREKRVQRPLGVAQSTAFFSRLDATSRVNLTPVLRCFSRFLDRALLVPFLKNVLQ